MSANKKASDEQITQSIEKYGLFRANAVFKAVIKGLQGKTDPLSEKIVKELRGLCDKINELGHKMTAAYDPSGGDPDYHARQDYYQMKYHHKKDEDFKALDNLTQKAQKLLRENKLEEAKKVQQQAQALFDQLYEVSSMKKGSNAADRIAAQHTIATRIVKKSYMVLKVPVGYSFIHNAKAIISAHSGVAVEDEDLEAIIARFLDLVIFSLTKDPTHAGDAMPSTDQFFQIVDEVLASSENRYGDDEEDGEDFDRYDDEDFGDDDEDEDEDEGEGRF